MLPIYPDAAILIFAKEPIPGKVKTRLIPVLGTENTTRLYVQLLKKTIKTVVDSNLADVYLYITPESNPLYFESDALTRDIKLRIQQGNDLGDKMFNALDQILKQYHRAVLIGTDCPFLDAEDLHAAFVALKTAQPITNSMVFSPALDGGYVMVGASHVCREVFADIEWGTDKVMSQTRAALQNHHIHWHELTHLQDIDNGDDLQALSQLNGFEQWSMND